MSFRGGGTAGGGRRGQVAPEFVRHVPKFLQKYSQMLERPGFHDEADKALEDYRAAALKTKFAKDEEQEAGDWREELEGATIVGGEGHLEAALAAPEPKKEELEASKAKEKGNKAFAEGKHEDAIRHFGRAIVLTPSNHVLYSNRSAAHRASKDYHSALKDARKAVELKPDWPKGHARLGEALFALKEYEQALEAYEKGLEVDPGNSALLDAVKQVRSRREAEERADAQAGRHRFKRKKKGVWSSSRAGDRAEGAEEDPNIREETAAAGAATGSREAEEGKQRQDKRQRGKEKLLSFVDTDGDEGAQEENDGDDDNNNE